jgi:hypothetical protein
MTAERFSTPRGDAAELAPARPRPVCRVLQIENDVCEIMNEFGPPRAVRDGLPVKRKSRRR